MKKTSLFLAVLCMAVLCHAQPEVGTLSIQPKVGFNVANITHGHGTDPRVGVVGGIELQSQLASYVGVSYGILYSMQGLGLCSQPKLLLSASITALAPR